MQVEGEGVLVMPQYLTLHKALWERQQSALRRAQPDQIAVAEMVKTVGHCCSRNLRRSAATCILK